MEHTSPPILDIDLDEAPRDRWHPLAAYREQALALLREFAVDISDSLGEVSMDEVRSLAREVLSPSEMDELRGVAEAIGAPFDTVLLGNLYYDALKHIWGCTAFAIPTPKGPLHARNLDWPSRGDGLLRATLQLRFTRGGQEIYTTVGWPGYIGCLSGTAPGRFSITLNTVASVDLPSIATPVSFLIRRLLESDGQFRDALAALQETDVASDSLLLLVGTKNEEMAVIERTPSRAAVRARDGNALIVTNDYRILPASEVDPSNDLASTSCDRFERVAELVEETRPRDVEAAHQVLSDQAVRMRITAQHMVFCPATSLTDVRYPQHEH